MYFIVIPHLLGIFFTPVICGFLNSTQFFLKISEKWDFPGALVVKTPHFSMQEAWVPPLVEELRPRMPHGVAKKKKKNQEKNSTWQNYMVKSALTHLLPVDITTGQLTASETPKY